MARKEKIYPINFHMVGLRVRETEILIDIYRNCGGEIFISDFVKTFAPDFKPQKYKITKYIELVDSRYIHGRRISKWKLSDKAYKRLLQHIGDPDAEMVRQSVEYAENITEKQRIHKNEYLKEYRKREVAA
jgi:hypothetical protein